MPRSSRSKYRLMPSHSAWDPRERWRTTEQGQMTCHESSQKMLEHRGVVLRSWPVVRKVVDMLWRWLGCPSLRLYFDCTKTYATLPVNNATGNPLGYFCNVAVQNVRRSTA